MDNLILNVMATVVFTMIAVFVVLWATLPFFIRKSMANQERLLKAQEQHLESISYHMRIERQRVPPVVPEGFTVEQ